MPLLVFGSVPRITLVVFIRVLRMNEIDRRALDRALKSSIMADDLPELLVSRLGGLRR